MADSDPAKWARMVYVAQCLKADYEGMAVDGPRRGYRVPSFGTVYRTQLAQLGWTAADALGLLKEGSAHLRENFAEDLMELTAVARLELVTREYLALEYAKYKEDCRRKNRRLLPFAEFHAASLRRFGLSVPQRGA